MAKKVTSLYINEDHISLAVTKGRRIRCLADAPLDMNQAGVTQKVREAELNAKIKYLLKNNKVRTKKVAIGISGRQCLSRPIYLPYLPRAMMQEAIIREARRVLPVPPEQLYISWQMLHVVQGQMQGFMVAIPRHIADEAIGAAKQAGLKPYIMDIKPMALARLVPEPKAVLVDVQEKEFDIVVISEGIPQPVRTVPFPEENTSPSEKLEILRNEFGRTIQFFNANNAESKIGPDVKVYVSGQADSIGITGVIEDEFGYQALPLAVPMKKLPGLNTADYLVNIGLAFKEMPREKAPLLVNLNAMPASYLPKQVDMRKVMIVPAAAAAVALIFLLVMVIQESASEIASANSQLDTASTILEQRQEQKNELVQSIAALEGKVSAAEASLSLFAGVLEGFDIDGELVNVDLSTVVGDLVPGIELTGINHSGESLSLGGRALSEVEVLQYSRNLDASGRFKSVTVASIRQIETEEEEDEEEEETGEGENQVVTMVQFTLTLELAGAS